MQKHITILGVILVAFHIAGPIVAVFLFSLLSGTGLLSGDVQAVGVLTLIGGGIAFLLISLTAPGLIAGVGILKGQRWARYLALFVGVLHLLDPPFGTALGVYTIWVLSKDESIALLDR